MISRGGRGRERDIQIQHASLLCLHLDHASRSAIRYEHGRVSQGGRTRSCRLQYCTVIIACLRTELIFPHDYQSPLRCRSCVTAQIEKPPVALESSGCSGPPQCRPLDTPGLFLVLFPPGPLLTAVFSSPRLHVARTPRATGPSVLGREWLIDWTSRSASSILNTLKTLLGTR